MLWDQRKVIDDQDIRLDVCGLIRRLSALALQMRFFIGYTQKAQYPLIRNIAKIII